MAYAELHAKLSERPPPTILTFPDGSIDSYSRSRSERGRLDSIRELSRELARGKRSFHLEPESREKGGQAVNMATQVHALGGRAELYGHLDDPLFEDLPFRTVSMGDPAAVSVLELGDDGLLFATESDDIRDWTADELRTAMGGDFAPIRDADGACCGNIASFPALLDVMRSLAGDGGSEEGGAFVLDPGDLTDVTSGTIADYFSALSDLDDGFKVVLSVNDVELARLRDAVEELDGTDGAKTNGDESKPGSLERIRDEAGISAVVFHGKERAIAATREGTYSVPNLTVSTVERTTGAGDRFSGGLTFGRASGWDWKPTLTLANVCTSRYVETATTVDTETVLSEEWK
ncbi:PfkB family carbohydrate kinase [Haladaptatus sp. DYF46]|uniref:carbohydrate kinase family protein n=1 Tax=Haladaptatus sp. DYF46 TaxID=2886041 RepID=UPI001E62CCDC